MTSEHRASRASWMLTSIAFFVVFRRSTGYGRLRRDRLGFGARINCVTVCKLHFLLRPASLPPVAGLFTSRFGLHRLR
jgi:hypothetical protein